MLEEITGFGSTGSCILCKEAKQLCPEISSEYCLYCIYSVYKYPAYNMFCLDNTYDAVADAKNTKDLYEAIQERVKYLEETIGFYQNLSVL